MINFDKVEIKKQITTDMVFQLLEDWGGEPQYTDFGILSRTICHNPAFTGSRKLYYYANEDTGSGLFHCYSGNCGESGTGSFDIFELAILVSAIQEHRNLDLNDAVRMIAFRLGIVSYIEQNDEEKSILQDWELFDRYEKIETAEPNNQIVKLKDYDEKILSRFNYEVKITPWLDEGITQEVMDKAMIGYYAGGNQITIPHFDADGRFIGLRGRTLSAEDAERFGKYRPIKIAGTQYAHPLGWNCYGLNWAEENIRRVRKVIVVEAEKSVLKYMSYFGLENNICIAVCGSSLSFPQMNMLLSLGVQEVTIAFDKCGTTDDKDIKKYVQKFYNFNNKYKKDVLMSFIYDKDNKYLDLKDSPLDKGKDIFLKLFKERIFL